MKKKFKLEYNFHTTAKLLFDMVSTPWGFSEWFADDVNIENKIFTFRWNKTYQKAKVLSEKENKHIRFQWLDEVEDKTYFEFKINIDELTNDVALEVIDFTEENELKDSINLWNSQIDKLKHKLGS